MRSTSAIAVLLALGLSGTLPAAAQGISIGPGGVRVDPDGGRGGRFDDGMSRRDAVRIARREGLADVDNVERRGRRLIVHGSDRRGDDITVVVDGRTGDVLDVRH